MDINRNNYENYFLLYLDRELPLSERMSVEKFISENTDLLKEFDLLQQTIISAPAMVFDKKETLYRKEEKRRIIPFNWTRIAAGFILLILSGWFVKTQIAKNNQPDSQIVVENKAEKNSAIVKKAEITKQDLPVVKDNEQTAAVIGQRPSVIGHRSSVIGKPSTINHQPSTPANDQPSTEETLIAVQKSTVSVPLQSTENSGVQQTITDPGTPAVAVVLASSAATDASTVSYADLKEKDIQSDDAISVIALNDKNKSITGFFKKLTKRAPADEKERKVRVSVFQFSY